MKAIVPIGFAMLVTGIVLVMTAANQPDYVDKSGILIEPFAHRAGGSLLIALGAVLLAWHYHIRGRS
jgi:hypothetical protein